MAEVTSQKDDGHRSSATSEQIDSSLDDTQSRSNSISQDSANSRIAIVGMACRFPGAPDLATFWEKLVTGTKCVVECPAGVREGRVGELYEDTSTIPSACRYGAFLTDIDQFDAEFFRISPSEAEFLDPQQRMMLETSWRALENANIDPEQLRGSSASVYAGMSNNDYRYLILGGADTSQPAASLYTITGTSLNTAIGRVSFAMGFEGPAMTVDTACSSSLVAMHQAATALQLEETDVALAGGVQLILSGKLTELRANAGMLSPDGTCKTFDEAANGYVRGEGCGIVVLKRLEDAQRDGDHIWAEVAATAINQDGTSDGLTVPRGSAQKAVIVAALDQAEIQPLEVDYLEAHGTGTPVGDPIEINAAAEIYGAGRSANQPLLIGSVKTNIGHLEPAAGVAGVIKAAMAIRFGYIPKHLNFENPSSEIAWDSLPVKVVSEAMPWPQKDVSERLAGINSFGFSGTNAHVLLRGYGEFTPLQDTIDGFNTINGPAHRVASLCSREEMSEEVSLQPPNRHKRLLPLSAKSTTAHEEIANEYANWLEAREENESEASSDSDSFISDFCWTASIGRTHFNYRKALLVNSRGPSANELRNSISMESVEPCSTREMIAFAYTGQGSQWTGMGKALYESEPVFRHTIDRCEEVIQSERSASLIDRLFGAPGTEKDLEDPTWVQPCIYAIECALTDLWQSLAVIPDVVLGHSLGEIAAARTAGVFSLEDGCRFASARGRLMSALPGPGAMAAVFVTEDEATQAIAKYNEELNGVGISIAALNGAHQVLSGYAHEIEPLLARFEQHDVRVRRLKKSPAYHSALVEPILDELAHAVDQLEIGVPNISLISNLTGELVADGTRLDSAYWRRHARQGVAYRRGVSTLASLGVDTVLEIGPNAVLGPMTQLSWPEEKELPTILASLRMPRDDRPEIPADGGFLNCVAEAYEKGLDIGFQSLFAGEERRKLNIPGYVFQHRRHWVQTSKRRSTSAGHPLLGARHESPRGEIYYETELSTSDPSWLNDHRAFGQVLVPGAFYGSMGIACLDDVNGVFLDELQLHSPMVFKDPSGEEDEHARQVQLILQGSASGSKEFEVFSKDMSDEKWTLHATGQLARNSEQLETPKYQDLGELTSSLNKQDLVEYYKQKAATNIQLGPPFQNLKSLWVGDGEAVAEISLSEDDHIKGIDLQPLVLDACFQVFSAARQSTGVGEGATYIPFGWERLALSARIDSTLVCHARMNEVADVEDTFDSTVPEALTGDLWMYDRSGRQLGSLTGFTVKRATRSSFLSAVEDPTDLIYETVWRNIDHPSTSRREHPLADLNDLQSNIEPFFSYLRSQGVTPEQRYSLLQDLEKLAHSWVIAALDSHGLDRVKGKELLAEELMVQMGILPIHKNLVNRILKMMVEADVLAKSSDGAFTVSLGRNEEMPKEVSPPDKLFKELQAKHPHGQYELTLLNRFGSNFIDLLTGNADPLALLFEEDSSGAADFYKTAPVSVAGNRLLGDVIDRLLRDVPDDRLLRVLEVGAGTGATTEIVFSELESRNLEYTYTDISAGFFSEAERNFEGNGIDIEYRVLDIEKDPASQGFDESHYDIVIAANVLHATQNLLETLTNCRQLLVPGGVLIALESLRGRAWQDLTFGFLDGWWRFNDSYRKNHALASPDIWRKALEDAGYVDSHVFGGETLTANSGPLGSGTVVAFAPEQTTLQPGTWIIELDSGGLGNSLQQELMSLGQSVIATKFEKSDDESGAAGSAPCGHSELGEILSELREDEPLRGVIHLSALDGNGVGASTDQMATDVRHATESALSLTQVLMDSGLRPSNGTWFVTRGAQVLECEQSGELAGSALWGFGKVAGLESSFLGARMFDLDPDNHSVDNLIDELLTPNEEDHVAIRRNTRYVARLIRASESASRIQIPEEPDWIMASGRDGSLSNVQTARLERESLQSREVRVQVATTGLNFSDVLVALGAQVPNASLGLEFAGFVTELGEDVNEFSVGQRVVGMGFGTFGPEVATHAELVTEAPANLTLDQLATLPIVFATAGIAFELAELNAGDRVLVHAAAGGVGLAAIQLVQAAGAEVFATASNPKQEFLKSMGIEHVFDSRSLDFSKEILETTQNEGVDIVLNSLTSEGFIEASLACLKPEGRFIEIGRLNILTPEEMAQTRPDVAYHILSLDELKREKPDRVGQSFRNLMDRFASGELNPLRHSKWPMAEIGDALQYMGSAKHVGKLVLAMPALAQGQLSADRTFLVTGGFGGIGCAVANWLAERGAKNIVLNGRRDPDFDAVQTIEELRERGIRVETQIADVTDASSIDGMLNYIDREMPALGGVVHSVGVLSDGSITNQTWQRFEEVLWPKILGAWHLHQATKHRDLDLFVLFSSATGVLGNAGQANHASANAFLDQLAAHRRSLGLCGQSIAWGAWSEIGEAAEHRERIASQLESSGTEWISPDLGIRTLDYLVSHDLRNPAAMSVDWDVLEQGFDTPPTFLKELLASDEDTDQSRSDAISLDVGALRSAEPEDRIEVLMSYIQKQLQSILRLASLPSPTVGFFDLGMDSLMAVELRNRLLRVFEGEITVSRTAVFDYPNVEALATHLSDELAQGGEATGLSSMASANAVSASTSKIAVIGLACRFPGANHYIDFWRNLEAGADAITADRGQSARWSGVVGDSAAKESYLKYGGFVDGLDEFDAPFFRIRPIEARSMDPRQRMLLETCWEAIESAGIDPESLRGQKVGVYFGLGASEYRDIVNASGLEDSYLGTSSGMTTGRISYVFGFMGPAMSFDLACASSLVSIHEGIKALQTGEIDLALVGGANAILSQSIMRFHRELGMLALDGKCLPFDEQAEGYVRGEGCGALLLKRVDEAHRDGDPIWSTMLGSAVNQNGASAGMTVPNGPAQEQLIRDAVARSGVEPTDIDYLEAHATGLSLSDPIEISAASSVYAAQNGRERPLLLGSVKSNIGHLEWAAGVAGVMKLILAMAQRKIPAQLHLKQPSAQIEWNELGVEVNRLAVDWPERDRPPIGAVSAFGMSGTNAHVIVEGGAGTIQEDGNPSAFPVATGGPLYVEPKPLQVHSNIDLTEICVATVDRNERLLVLSGKKPESVVSSARKLENWLIRCTEGDQTPEFMDEFLADAAWTTCVGRSKFDHRHSIAFSNCDDLLSSLSSLSVESLLPSPPESTTAPKVVFAMGGCAHDWMNIGTELCRSEPLVGFIVNRCSEQLEALANVRIEDSMVEFRTTKSLKNASWMYPATYAMQVAVAAYWQALGLEPAAVVGTGIGNIAASCIANALSFEDGLEMSWRLANNQKSIAGSAIADEQVNAQIDNPKVKVVDAFTSFCADDSDSLLKLVESLNTAEDQQTNLSLSQINDIEADLLVEISPFPIFSNEDVSQGTGNSADIPIIAAIHAEQAESEDHPALVRLLPGIKLAYDAHLPIELSSLFAGESRRRLTMPTYPFERRSYWFNE